MITGKRLKIILRPAIRFLKFRILHVDDSPHRIALGVALGLFVAYMPPLGFHILLIVLLTMFIRANKFVALSCVWASNPLTFIPVYYPNYLMGKVILGSFGGNGALGANQVEALFADSFTVGRIITGIGTAEFWQQLCSLLVQAGLEMLIGGLIIGGAIATAAYFATYKIVRWHRQNHPHRRFQKHI